MTTSLSRGHITSPTVSESPTHRGRIRTKTRLGDITHVVVRLTSVTVTPSGTDMTPSVSLTPHP
eukprot:scaffold233262_cov35-Attheya_sp.AAC.1